MFKHLKCRLPSRTRSRRASVLAAPPPPPPQPVVEAPSTTVADKSPPYLLAPRCKSSTLFELEALLSSIVDAHSHNSKAFDRKLENSGVLPSYEELYKELDSEEKEKRSEVPVSPTMMMPEAPGFVPEVTVTIPELPELPENIPPRTLRRKPRGLDRGRDPRQRSSREKALEALMRLLDTDRGEKVVAPVVGRGFPGGERMGAVRRRALEGLRRRGWDVSVIRGSGGVSL